MVQDKAAHIHDKKALGGMEV